MYKLLFCELQLKDKAIWFYLLTFFNIFLNLSIILLLDSESGKMDELITNYSFFEQIIFFGIFGPIIEEFIFRFPLTKNRSYIDYIFLLTIPLTLFIFISSLNIKGLNNFYLLLIYLFFYFIFRKDIKSYIINNYFKYFIFKFYALNLLFAFIHIENYSERSFIVIIILIFLTFISSLLFSFVRTSIGFL